MSLSFKKLSSAGEQTLLVSMFDFPVTVAEAPLKGVASTGDVDCMWCQVGYKTYFKWMETVPLRRVKSSCRSAFESEKIWKSAADCPRLRLFRAVKVMELTCHNLAVSYTNRISRFYLWRAPCIGFTAYRRRDDGFVRGFVLRLPRCSCGALQSASPNNRHRLAIISCIPRAELRLKHSPVIQALIISVTVSLSGQKYYYNEKKYSTIFSVPPAQNNRSHYCLERFRWREAMPT